MISFHTKILINAPIKKQQHDGRDYIVAPAVIMVEGVHNGSGGPTLWTAEELGKYPARWDGIPVVVNHPYYNDGTPRSANEPEVLEKQCVGKLFHTFYDAVEKKLKSEVWVEEIKAKKIAPEILGLMEKGQLELSTGVATDNEAIPGIWNEETYDSIAKNLIPDHLALLPGSEGACSWLDGCGIRLNSVVKGGKTIVNAITRIINGGRKIISQNLLITNEESFQEIERALMDVLNSPVPQRWEDEKWIDATYDAEFIYEAYSGGEWKLFKRSYSINENGEATLGEDITEVNRKVSYIELQSNKEEEQKMVDKIKTEECCEAEINALIANEATQWVETDREHLEALPEQMIKKMAPVVLEEKPAEESITETVIEKKKEEEDDGVKATEVVEPVKTLEEKPQTVEEFVKTAPPEMQEVFNQSLETHSKHKKAMVTAILAYEQNTFSEAELNAKKVDELSKLVGFLGVEKTVEDYGMGFGDTVKKATELTSMEENKMREIDWSEVPKQ